MILSSSITPGQRREVTANKSTQHQVAFVSHQRLIIWMTNIAAHARIIHPSIIPCKRGDLFSFPGTQCQLTCISASTQTRARIGKQQKDHKKLLRIEVINKIRSQK